MKIAAYLYLATMISAFSMSWDRTKRAPLRVTIMALLLFVSGAVLAIGELI